MNFDRTQKYINSKINELQLPFFNVIVKREGKELYSYSYPNNTNIDTLLIMYSMSKPITVAAFMQLVEQGKVSVDDPVSKYIPEFHNLINKDTRKPIKTEMKIWHLLTMTSGMDYDRWRNATKELLAKGNPTTLEACKSFVKDGILFEPGTKYNYSLSIDVIAAIIEIISKEKFSDYVENHIFRPLGMNNSTFKYCPDIHSKCVKEYDANEKGVVPGDSWYESFFIGTNYESGGAGLISTINDYSKFLDSLANNDNKILKEDSIKKMSTIKIMDTPFDEKVKEYSKSNKEYGYGYGVRVRKISSVEGLPVGEFGWDGARACYSLCDPINKISIVVGLNIGGWPTYLKNFHIALAKTIYKDIFNK